MKAEKQIWEVETQEGTYYADLPTLKQWVAEGIVLPSDRVRKRGFRWIAAEHVPALRQVFSGEERVEIVAPTPQAVHVGAGVGQAEAPPEAEAPPAAELAEEDSPDMGLAGDEPAPADDPPLSSACHAHPTQAATLFCRACSTTFCRACPNRVGSSSVLLCPLCGGFCDPLEILTKRLELYRRQFEGFGIDDFKTALVYPFKHLASLLGGALLYGLLLLAGLRVQLLAYAFVYGCIVLVVKRVGYGDLKRDFLPDFSEFSFWDDVVVPCSLGVGVTLVTLGPALLLVGVLIFGWVSTAHTPQRLPTDPSAFAGSGTKEEREALAEKIKEMQAVADASQPAGKEKLGEDSAVVYAWRLMLEHPGLVLLLGLLALGWAVFYYPMALLVAGWTESLKSVLNPLVGLDTIRHMGSTYFKAFFMYLAVQVLAVVLSVAVALLTWPFNLPLIGNLPATFLGGVVTFYTSLVVACLLGLALFKSADRLGIEID